MPMTLNSIDLRYTDAGQGLPMVLLHGCPLSRGVWQKQIEAIRSSYRVIAPDLRGLGDSEAQPSPTTIAQCDADLRVLLQRLTTGPVVLIGQSTGGYVALAFARQFPEMLHGLVLVSTKARQDTAEAAAQLRQLAELGIDLTAVTQELEDVGVKKFIEAYDKLIASLRAKIAGGKV